MWVGVGCKALKGTVLLPGRSVLFGIIRAEPWHTQNVSGPGLSPRRKLLVTQTSWLALKPIQFLSVEQNGCQRLMEVIQPAWEGFMTFARRGILAWILLTSFLGSCVPWEPEFISLANGPLWQLWYLMAFSEVRDRYLYGISHHVVTLQTAGYHTSGKQLFLIRDTEGF